MSHTRPTRFRYNIVSPSPDPCALSGPACRRTISTAALIGGVNRMSVQPGEFSEVTHSIPQDWASLAHYLARRGIVFGPDPPRQFARGYGNLNYLIEIDSELAVLRRPPAGPLPYGGNDMA